MWNYTRRIALSPEEIEAEILFVEAIHRRVSFAEAVMRARDIEARSKLAGRRLKWLLILAMRGGGDIRVFPMTIAV